MLSAAESKFPDPIFSKCRKNRKNGRIDLKFDFFPDFYSGRDDLCHFWPKPKNLVRAVLGPPGTVAAMVRPTADPPKPTTPDFFHKTFFCSGSMAGGWKTDPGGCFPKFSARTDHFGGGKGPKNGFLGSVLGLP